MRTSKYPAIRRVFRGTDFSRRKPSAFTPIPDSASITELLAKPTWSIRSLHPESSPSSSPSSTTTTATATTSSEEITREKLHHLLKLSALPPPRSPREETKMLQTLRDQIHFVRAVQSVDTTGVEPLITLRDETAEAVAEETVTLDKMLPYLALEEKVGRNGTVRRRDVVRSPEQDRAERATWEVDVGQLGVGSDVRRKGRFFYVKRSKVKKEEEVVVEVEERGNGVEAGEGRTT